ncbi:MAG TPA: hypothetical protein ENL35_05210, partial [Chloroflexi bacterium]|nr:hypothetical protein [Chloroflexota bacterium]
MTYQGDCTLPDEFLEMLTREGLEGLPELVLVLVNALQSACQGCESGYGDAFVTKLNAQGNALLYSTYLG